MEPNVYQYKIALVSTIQVEEHSQSKKFWLAQIEKYGADFFGNHSADALKSKWTKMLKDNKGSPKQALSQSAKALTASQKASIVKEIARDF